jgi:methylenetetrahydrofolate dehydrogenase (NADP+)/methenyltetrahydrofolate cyclohydrolase
MLSITPNNIQKIFDGKSFAQNILDNEVKPISSQKQIRLDIIWIGDNPESEIYVNYKQKKATECGIESVLHHLPSVIDQSSVEELVSSLNEDKSVTGYIIQLPVSEHIDYHKIFRFIDPRKDADGLSPYNLGLLWQYQNGVAPATPAGVMRILRESANLDLKGLNAVIINDSDIVGKPLGAMLLKECSTVSFCTKNTQDLALYTKSADIVITATGVAGLIKGEMIKDGSVLIDIGTKRVGKSILGDIDFESCKEKASFITPVPGGVGPVTVAMLLKNVVDLAR